MLDSILSHIEQAALAGRLADKAGCEGERGDEDASGHPTTCCPKRERERMHGALLRISHANTLENPVDCIQHNGPIDAAHVGWS